MFNNGKLNGGRLIVVAFGLFGILISLPLLGFAVLGFLGILADVSSAENREIGVGFLYLGLPPLIGGVGMCLLGLLVFGRNHRHADAEPGAAPDRRA